MIPAGIVELIFNRIFAIILALVLFGSMVACDVINQEPTAQHPPQDNRLSK